LKNSDVASLGSFGGVRHVRVFSVVIFTTKAQRAQRVLWFGCGGARICFRVFGVFDGLHFQLQGSEIFEDMNTSPNRVTSQQIPFEI